MKATQHYFPLVLFIMLYKRLWMNSKSVTIQVKAVELYFPVVLYVVL